MRISCLYSNGALKRLTEDTEALQPPGVLLNQKEEVYVKKTRNTTYIIILQVRVIDSIIIGL